MINRGIQTFDYSVDVLQAILWQYDSAPNISSLLTAKSTWYATNQTGFWTDFYNNIFNLKTANFFGLSVWSYILHVPLFVNPSPDPPGKPLWGFNAFAPSWPTLENTYSNFFFGNFSSSVGGLVLTLAEQRLLLQIRAYQIVSSGNIWDINAFFKFLFTNNPEWPAGASINALDGFNMTMTYVFNFDISYSLAQALKLYDVLPRPAGVGINYVVIPVVPVVAGDTFGFNAFAPSYPDTENTYTDFSPVSGAKLGNFYSDVFA